MNNLLILSSLPNHARVWVYTSNRVFTDTEGQEIETAGKEFVDSWKVHGSALEADFKILHNRFIVIAADEQVAGVSGCGIDSSVRFVTEAEKRYGVVLLDKLNLGYRDGSGEIKVLPMMDFQNKMDSGEITENTVVFNNLVESLGEMRASWETPLVESWHKQLL